MTTPKTKPEIHGRQMPCPVCNEGVVSEEMGRKVKIIDHPQANKEIKPVDVIVKLQSIRIEADSYLVNKYFAGTEEAIKKISNKVDDASMTKAIKDPESLLKDLETDEE